jgi:hypothetical protein
MKPTDEFLHYAVKAIRGALDCNDEDEKKNFIELAHTWTSAACASEREFAGDTHAPQRFVLEAIHSNGKT